MSFDDLELSDSDFELFQTGENMSRPVAQELECALLVSPMDFSARVKLLVFYSFNDIEVNSWLQHYDWLITNHPTHWFASNLSHSALSELQIRYLQQLWKDIVKSSNSSATVKGRAGQFFFSLDPEFAAELFQHAEILAPKTNAWSIELAYLYTALARRDPTSSASLSLAFDQGDAVLSRRMQRGVRHDLLTCLCELALQAHELEYADKYANKLKKLTLGVPHRDYMVNSYLGLIALRRSNINAAKKHLNRMAKSGFFDVNFAVYSELPRALLKVGEVSSVIEFLKDCKIYARSPHPSIDGWIADLYNGKIVLKGFNGSRKS